MTDAKTLGERLKSWREGLDATQRDIARAAGTRQPTLSVYEAGGRDSIPFHVVEAYATELRVPIALLTGKTFEEAVRDGEWVGAAAVPA